MYFTDYNNLTIFFILAVSVLPCSHFTIKTILKSNIDGDGVGHTPGNAQIFFLVLFPGINSGSTWVSHMECWGCTGGELACNASILFSVLLLWTLRVVFDFRKERTVVNGEITC